MSFPPRSQIIALDPVNAERAAPLLTVTFFGLYGPSGVLPTHYAQLLMDIQRDVRVRSGGRCCRTGSTCTTTASSRSSTARWENRFYYLQYDRGEAFRATPDTFTLALRSLMGLGSPGHPGSRCTLADDHRAR